MPKPLPSSIRDLRVPNPGFDYFAGCERHRFRPDATAFELCNAWWLAEASFLVYLKEKATVWSHLERAGFAAISFVANGGIHAVVAHDARMVLVVFRGTDVTDLRNLLTDASLGLRPFARGGRVHVGFRRALDRIWSPLASRIEALADGRRIWLTGHSLGAALATLAAARLARVDGLYTFGSPRVGDETFADGHPCRGAVRLVYEHDFVAELPPPVGGYRHVGELHHLRRNGRFSPGTTAWERWKDNVGVRIPRILSQATDPRALWRTLVQENALSDHAPIQYAVRLWNLYESVAT